MTSASGLTWTKAHRTADIELRRALAAPHSTFAKRLIASSSSLKAVGAVLTELVQNELQYPAGDSTLRRRLRWDDSSALSLFLLAIDVLDRVSMMDRAFSQLEDTVPATWRSNERAAIAALLAIPQAYISLVDYTLAAGLDPTEAAAVLAACRSTAMYDYYNLLTRLLAGQLKQEALATMSVLLAIVGGDSQLASAMQPNFCSTRLLLAVCVELAKDHGAAAEEAEHVSREVCLRFVTKALLSHAAAAAEASSSTDPDPAGAAAAAAAAASPLYSLVTNTPVVGSFLLASMKLLPWRSWYLRTEGVLESARLAGDLLRSCSLWLHALSMYNTGISSGNFMGAARRSPMSVSDIAGVADYALSFSEVPELLHNALTLEYILCQAVNLMSAMLDTLGAPDRVRAFMPIATFTRQAVAISLVLLRTNTTNGVTSDPAVGSVTRGSGTDTHGSGTDGATLHRGAGKVTHGDLNLAAFTHHPTVPSAGGVCDRSFLPTVSCTHLFHAALRLFVRHFDEQPPLLPLAMRGAAESVAALNRSRATWVVRSGLLPACDELLRALVPLHIPHEVACLAAASVQAVTERSAAAAPSAAAAAEAAPSPPYPPGAASLASSSTAQASDADAEVTEQHVSGVSLTFARLGCGEADFEGYPSVDPEDTGGGDFHLLHSLSLANGCLRIAMFAVRHLPGNIVAAVWLQRLSATARKAIVLYATSTGTSPLVALSYALPAFRALLWRCAELKEVDDGLRDTAFDAHAMQLLPAIVRLAKACLLADPGSCHHPAVRVVLCYLHESQAVISYAPSFVAGLPALLCRMIRICSAGVAACVSHAPASLCDASVSPLSTPSSAGDASASSPDALASALHALQTASDAAASASNASFASCNSPTSVPGCSLASMKRQHEAAGAAASPNLSSASNTPASALSVLPASASDVLASASDVPASAADVSASGPYAPASAISVPVSAPDAPALSDDAPAVACVTLASDADVPAFRSASPALVCGAAVAVSNSPAAAGGAPASVCDAAALPADAPSSASDVRVLASDEPSSACDVPSTMSDALASVSDVSASHSDAPAPASDAAASAQDAALCARVRRTAWLIEALDSASGGAYLSPGAADALYAVMDQVSAGARGQATSRPAAPSFGGFLDTAYLIELISDRRLPDPEASDCVDDDGGEPCTWDSCALAVCCEDQELSPEDPPLFFGCWWRGCTNLAGRSEAELQLRRCSGCRVARYCNELCQKRAWAAGHRAACQASARDDGRLAAAATAAAAAVPAAAVEEEAVTAACQASAANEGGLAAAAAAVPAAVVEEAFTLAGC